MSRYSNLNINKSSEGRPYLSNPIYPKVPESSEDLYIVSKANDRYDILAYKYYGDSSLWWIIASNNNLDRGSLFITPHKQVRIPANKQQAIKLFNQVNRQR